ASPCASASAAEPSAAAAAPSAAAPEEDTTFARSFSAFNRRAAESRRAALPCWSTKSEFD
ncbi:MAG: hypothetical protein VXU50_00880, partial [Verrucomicrobiota bacterium]|nr:hypothetical protein [Verrucomicrobiota bacterium]